MTAPTRKPIDERTAIAEVLKQGRILRGLTQSAAALAANGMKQQTWSKLENGEQAFDLEQLELLAHVIGLDRDTLLSEASKLMGRTPARPEPVAFAPSRPLELRILERVRAGAWLRSDDLDQSEPRTFPAAPDPRFPADVQWLSEVTGDSVNKLKIFDGDLVHLVSIPAIGYRVKTGDVVELERLRFGEREREYSLKQVEMTDDGPIYWPRSTNERWQQPLDPREKTENGEEIIVQVRALVLASIRRFRF